MDVSSIEKKKGVHWGMEAEFSICKCVMFAFFQSQNREMICGMKYTDGGIVCFTACIHIFFYELR